MHFNKENYTTEKLSFEDTTIEGYENPTILAGTDGIIEVIRSTPITVKESNLDECIQAHPGGVAFEDIGKFNCYLFFSSCFI